MYNLFWAAVQIHTLWYYSRKFNADLFLFAPIYPYNHHCSYWFFKLINLKSELSHTVKQTFKSLLAKNQIRIRARSLCTMEKYVWLIWAIKLDTKWISHPYLLIVIIVLLSAVSDLFIDTRVCLRSFRKSRYFPKSTIRAAFFPLSITLWTRILCIAVICYVISTIYFLCQSFAHLKESTILVLPPPHSCPKIPGPIPNPPPNLIHVI